MSPGFTAAVPDADAAVAGGASFVGVGEPFVALEGVLSGLAEDMAVDHQLEHVQQQSRPRVAFPPGT